MNRLLLLVFSFAAGAFAAPCDSFGTDSAAEARCLREQLELCRKEGENTDTNNVTTSTSAPSTTTGIPEVAPSAASRVQRNPPEAQYAIASSVLSTVKPASDNLMAELLHDRLAADLESRMAEIKNQMEIRILEIKRRNDQETKQLLKRIQFLSSRTYKRGSNEYLLSSEKESWYTAEEHCVEWGGHVTSVATDAENNFIRGLSLDAVWIGINDIQMENMWVNPDQSSFLFRNWAAGQPDNQQHNENCVAMIDGGKWDDNLCLIRRRYVCKRQLYPQ